MSLINGLMSIEKRCFGFEGATSASSVLSGRRGLVWRVPHGLRWLLNDIKKRPRMGTFEKSNLDRLID
jgi:hypothetical protein